MTARTKSRKPITSGGLPARFGEAEPRNAAQRRLAESGVKFFARTLARRQAPFPLTASEFLPIGPGAQIDAQLQKLEDRRLTVYDGGQDIDFNSDTHDNRQPSIADGIIKDEPYARITGYRIKRVRGIGACVTNRNGPWPPDDPGGYKILGNEFADTYTAIKTVLTDSRIGPDNLSRGSRDYGLHVARGWDGSDASNVQSTFNHFYGAWASCFVESSSFCSSHDEFADATYGYYGAGGSYNSRLLATSIFHCVKRSMLLQAKHRIELATVDVPMAAQIHSDTVGIELSAPDTTFLNGTMFLNWWANANDTNHRPAIAGILLRRGADRCQLHGCADLRPGLKNERFIVVKEAIYGGDFDFTLTGCTDQGDLALEIQPAAADMRGTDWYFKGHGLSKHQISIPNNLNKTNTITVKDTATGKADVVWPK